MGAYDTCDPKHTQADEL